eukprot:TRINITY_DN6705_c0_g1_i1.p1 TRINITY_DN6705_c0_g1~~TRINITY_DN6705_c0_g1_i1.p1  ORF type:complete len:150 (+),score=14.01 TRINITY_DN6705_c0_g1_i1:336-785(+)
MKIWKTIQSHIHEDSVAVFLGVSFNLGQKEVVLSYWNRNHELSLFQKSKLQQTMQRVHGPNWYRAIDTIYRWLKDDSDMWLNDQEIDEIVRSPQVYWIIGKNDVFSFSGLPEHKTKIIDADHFSILKSDWQETKHHLDSVLNNHNRSKL